MSDCRWQVGVWAGWLALVVLPLGPAMGAPVFGPEELVQAGGADLAVPGYSVPSLVHWDGDGLRDLVVGEGGGSGAAKVRVYLNDGTASAPQFDDWFYAKDGSSYRTAFGPVFVLKARDLLGFTPKGNTNWYIQVGRGDGAIILAGCRVHSAIATSTKPLGSHVYDARSS